MICEKCGQDVQGIIEWSTHPCNGTTIVWDSSKIQDNDIRNWFMEIGMPNMGFEAMGYAKPTEMERRIFKQDEP